MNSSYNILILSAGRRVELLNCFKCAAKKLNIKSIIVGGDCKETAPALYFADKARILPPISSPDYIKSVIETCNQDDVSLIVPTIDTDLLLLARNREKIESHTRAKILISAERVIEVCQNKIYTHEFLKANGFKVPRLYTKDELGDPQGLIYPLFIKPGDGNSSIDAFKVNNPGELKAYTSIIENPIVQDYLEGEEYTVDNFLDFDGNIITVVPRLRIATRSGEISKGRIIKDREIISEMIRLLNVLKPLGQVTIQCMRTKRGIEFVEINPRFGGGAPMSIASGADSCENLYRLLMGQRLEYNEEYRDNLLFLRYDSSICLNENMEIMGHSFGSSLSAEEMGIKV